jgi:HD-GYP domain-containing protein (c-di-GMP phosphodiesterase class II)/ActR/RegA family two-component response regulator
MSTIVPPHLERMEAALATHYDAAYFLELAETYWRSGHLQRAVRVLQRGLENHPTSGAGFALLARVLDDEGRHAEALACWERVLELDPGNEAARHSAAESRARLNASAGEAAPGAAGPPEARSAAPPSGGAAAGTFRDGPAWRMPSRPETYSPPPSSEAGGWSPPVGEAAPGVWRRPAAEAAEGRRTGVAQPADRAADAAGGEVPHGDDAAETEPGASSPDRRDTEAPAREEPMPWELPMDERARNGAAVRSTEEAAEASVLAAGFESQAVVRPARRHAEHVGHMVRRDGKHVDSMAVAIADLLVGLLEYRDPFFRGGTSLTRLLTAAIAREMGLEDARMDEIVLGAVLRDLGQLPLKGLISKGADFSEDAKRQVERHVDTALELLDGVELPDAVRLTIRHHHERWDGTGYPDRLTGDAIPLGARIVAVADTFAAMIAARPHRLPKRVPAALEDIRSWSGTRYDPQVVDALLRAVATSDWRGLGFGLRHHLILVDPDETRAMVLATRLCSHGYLAEASFSVDGALERMKRSRISGLLVSADLPDGDAMRLLREVRGTTRLGMIPIIMTEAGVTDRVPLLETGADVCLPRGSSFEELKATFEAFLRREGKSSPPNGGNTKSAEAIWAGLQGDIEDFPLNWLLQVLNYDARTAAVFIVGEDDEGAIYLEKGHPRHAQTRSLSGEAAFRAMLKWHAGSFSVDPDAKTEDLTIRTPLMNLLLDQAVAEDHASFFGSVRTEP